MESAGHLLAGYWLKWYQMWFYFHSSQFTVQSERDWRNENNKMFCALSESGNHHGNWKKAIVRNQKSYIIWFILQLLPSAVNNVIEKDFYFLDGLKLEVVSFFHSQIYENFLFTACFVSKVGKCPRFFDRATETTSYSSLN